MINEGTITFALLGWTMALIVWTEVVGHRARNINALIEREVRRRTPRRRPRPRPQASHVHVHPTLRDRSIGNQVEDWLRETQR